MTEKLKIPIISRGRIILPGEDAVEFGAEGESRSSRLTRTSTSRTSCWATLLSWPTSTDAKIADIVDLLAEAGKRLRLEDNPLLQESFALALQAGGLAEPILRRVYDELPGMFDPQGAHRPRR